MGKSLDVDGLHDGWSVTYSAVMGQGQTDWRIVGAGKPNRSKLLIMDMVGWCILQGATTGTIFGKESVTQLDNRNVLF